MSIRAFTVGLVSILLFATVVIRADEPAEVAPPTIDPLPVGWKHGEDTPKVHKGQNDELKAFFDVIAEPKTMAFDAWCKKAKKHEDKVSELSDEKQTPVKTEKIGDYNVTTYDSTGMIFGEPAHARIYFVELPNEFARLSCSTFEKVWDKVSGVLDDLVKNMK